MTIPLPTGAVVLTGTTDTEKAALHHHMDCLRVLGYCRHVLLAPGLGADPHGKLVEQIDALIGYRPAPSGPPRPDAPTGPPIE